MADLRDTQLVEELKRYGEIETLPIKPKRRPLLAKKLNHLRAKHRRDDLDLSSRPSTRAYGGPSNLEALSSDDSDMELNDSRQNETHLPTASINSKPSSSPYKDTVLRTMRRRTLDNPPPPPRRSTRRSEVLELSTERNDHEEINNAKTFAPSPARSKLYPDLSRFTSAFRRPNTDNFESSDSEGDVSTYSVENKSVNKSFPSELRDRSHHFSPGFASSSKSVTPSYDSNLSHHRSIYTRRYQMNGPGSMSHRVQQYRSRLSEYLPLLLIAIAGLFFLGLSVTYAVKHKDFIFSWLSTSDSIGSDDKLLYCKDEFNISSDKNCFTQEEVTTALDYIRDVYAQLSAKKGAVVCSQAKPGEDVLKISVLNAQILSDSLNSDKADRILRCCILHILANPHWNILPLKTDGSEALSINEVSKLESSVAHMTFWCRLHRSFTQVMHKVFYVCFAIFLAVLAYMYFKHHMKKRGQEQRDVYAMVDRIINVLQEHHEQFRRDDFDESPYLAVQHVRDQLLPPAQRRQNQPIWDKAVDFIAANESRIRMEAKIIRGEQFDVWYWLQPPLHNGKVWQGQAFGENNDNNSNQIVYCPYPCLKIRNMFDSNVENEENWEEDVIDAILEKCRGISSILHIFVDVGSKEGCVYMKCSSSEDAGKARTALNGWWFDGRLVTVKHLKTDHYHKRWPESRTATTPLKPSTNQMRSLSQPFYRSSLEMT